jgi:hypothetical protein
METSRTETKGIEKSSDALPAMRNPLLGRRENEKYKGVKIHTNEMRRGGCLRRKKTNSKLRNNIAENAI